MELSMEVVQTQKKDIQKKGKEGVEKKTIFLTRLTDGFGKSITIQTLSPMKDFIVGQSVSVKMSANQTTLDEIEPEEKET